MQDVDPDVPNSVKYPLEEIRVFLLAGFRQGIDLDNRPICMTSSIAQAIALAIFQRYTHIRVYGVEMGSDTEYQYQRDFVAFWTGYALGRGATVEFVSGDALWNRPIYGYDGTVEQPPNEFEGRADELREMEGEALKSLDRAKKALQRAYKNSNLPNRITEVGEAYTELGKVRGALAENVRYGGKAHAMLIDAGTVIIDRNEYEGAAAQANKDAEEYGQTVYRTAGRMDIVLASYMNNHDPTLLQHLENVMADYFIACENSGRAQGIKDENWKYAQEIDKLIRAAGGEKAVAVIKEGAGV